jgi:hypothetical protein
MRHRWPCLAVVALLGWATGGVAQNVTAVGFEGVSNQALLERSRGIGVFAVVGPKDWLDVSVGLAWSSGNASERDGLACAWIQPRPQDCTGDLLTEKVQVRSFRVSVHPHMALLESLQGTAGVGISTNDVQATSVTTMPNRMGNLYTPPSAHMGGFLQLGLAWGPFDQVPLDLVVGATGHWIFFDGCRTGATLYAPFCGVERITELTIGVSLQVFY